MKQTLLDYLYDCRERGSKPCFFFKTGYRNFPTSCEEFFYRTQRMAACLDQMGLKQGERVLLWGMNSPDWVASFLACVLKRLIPVPMDFRGNAAFVEKIFHYTNAALILCDPVKQTEIQTLKTMTFDGFRETAEKFPYKESTPVDVHPSDIAEILFTSGTTAEPKGVVLTHRNIVSNVETLSECIQSLGRNEKWLSLLPLSHIYEQTIGLWIPFKRGFPITYLENLKPALILKTLGEDDITVVPIVPRLLKLLQSGILRELKRHGLEKIFDKLLAIAAYLPRSCRYLLFPALRHKFGKIKYFLVGGATFELELERFWGLLGFQVLQGYGLSETSPVLSSNFPSALRIGSIGKVIPGVEVKIAEDKEILARGPSIFSGYYKNPEMTRAAFTPDGWFRTGDLGEFDPDGYLWFRGRKKDMIVTAEGLNVYPQDIEAEFHQIPGIKESCVLGTEKDHRQLIHAVLLLDDKSLNARATVDQVNARLADYQKIQSFSIWPGDDFPRTTTMKVKKEEILRVLRGETLAASKPPKTEKETPRLFELAAQLSGLKPEQIHPGSKLGADLGLSSLDRVELAAMIEEEFSFALDDGLLESETTLGEVEQMIDKKKGSGNERRIPKWPVSVWARLLRIPLQYLFLLPVTRFFCRIRVEGVENLRALPGSVIFVANHSSYFDAPALLAAFPADIRSKITIAAWREFFEPETKNIFVWLWKRALFYLCALTGNIYPFPQTKGFKKSFEHAGWLVDRGHHILIFPEGERTSTGQPLEFRKGIDLIVNSLQVPVVPIGLKGLFEILPKQRKFPKRGDVICRFGSPIRFTGAMRSEIRKRLREEIIKLIQ